MAQRFSSFFECLVVSVLFSSATGCSESSSLDDLRVDVGLKTAALSVCNETVPPDRNVDGIPAYEQCPAAESSAIYSNNGVDTSTTKMGSDWYETQYDNGYQCTEFVVRYMYFKWKVKWLPDEDAGFWCDKQPPADSGIALTMTPVHGDIMVFAPNTCGSDDEGHVGLVDQVNGSKLVVVEENDARRGDVMMSCGKCFLHVVANDGSGGPASAGAAGASGPASGSGAAGSPGAAGASASGAAGASSGTADDGAPNKRPPPPPTAADGAAAPSGGSAGRGAIAPPTATVPMTPSAGRSGSTSSASTSAADGGSAVASSATNSAPAGGCSVACVGGEQNLSLPIALALSLLCGVRLRARRRQHA